MDLDNHPTVIEIRRRNAGETTVREPGPLDADLLKRLCLEAGADDVGLVEIDRPELVEERVNIEAVFSHAKTLVSFVCKMNRDPIRSPARSIANLEFHQTTDRVNEVAQRIVAALHERGFRAINPAAGFPMEMDRFPDRIWMVSEKTVAVAAGLGQMGIHRNVIHPIFGNFILLGVVITDARVTEHARPIDYNPCLECKLCVAACPVGAIGDDGHFNFSACFTHNYREFMGGFIDWVETIAGSDGAASYRRKVPDSETASIWQTLSFGANYKAAYCMAVCPAGEEVISPFLADRKNYLREVVKPLQAKVEPVYVVSGSDAETHVRRRFPHKKPRLVSNGIRPTSIKALFTRLPVVFQREASSGLDATYLFTFTGEENGAFTVEIRNKTVVVHSGQIGTPDLHVTADSRTWLEFVNKQRGILWALLTRKIRLKGQVRLLKAFGRCFPS
jgi:Fe-S-cluster-containing hydrogenase component 2